VYRRSITLLAKKMQSEGREEYTYLKFVFITSERRKNIHVAYGWIISLKSGDLFFMS